MTNLNILSMKKLLTTVLLGLACVPGVLAQSMVITRPDGTYTKFNTDYVQEVTIVERPSGDVTTFGSVEAMGYSAGDAELIFKSESVDMLLWIYGPQNSRYLEPGQYTVDASNAPFTVDSDARYSNVTKGGEKIGISAGTMTVAETNNVYTFNIDFTLADGSVLKAEATATLPGYSPVYDMPADIARVININDAVDGEIGIRFANNAYNYELTMDFICEPGTTVLTPGEYRYSAEKTPGTFGPLSSIDMYRPNDNTKVSGLVNVQLEGDNYVIQMDLTGANGRRIDIRYEGPIDFEN